MSSDEGFHEIQLNGKQLIFLCMTAALVLVVAFLTGVLVGRGVHTQADATVAAAAADSGATPGQASDPASAAAVPVSEPAAPPITAVAPPIPADEDLSYNSRLQGKEPPKETVPPPTAVPAQKAKPAPQPKDEKAAPAPAAAPPPARPEAEAAKATNTSIPGEPPGNGWYLKIAAFRERAPADTLARRLGGKGLTAYVVRAKGLYSVRVGKYGSRREADTTRRRLEKEEQLKPLISR